jgi:hypothetical protein
MSIELDSFVLAGQESDLDSEFQLELEPETNMDADKEVRQRLLDGRESSSYTDLSYSRASKDTSLLVLELDDDVPSQQNPFLDPEVAERYAQIYEDAEYECRHAFDPKLTWTREEEKAIVRKVDWHVCLWAVRLIPPSNA